LFIAAPRWVALLLVLDSRPFAELRHIVRKLDDERIWVYAEMVSYMFIADTMQQKVTQAVSNACGHTITHTHAHISSVTQPTSNATFCSKYGLCMQATTLKLSIR
jgi:hypothetical protein